MKKIEKVSIAEISFTLDNDAYHALKQYLDSLHSCYAADPDGREIIADIEARIAELILEEQIYTKVVGLPLIERIIAQLGTPDQIDDQGDDPAGDGYAASGFGGGLSSGDGSIPRRLHRSAERKLLGGVCSGIAQYLDINVFWVRLVFLFPLTLAIFGIPFHMHWRLENFIEGWSWVFFVIYIVLWIALPMARTPRQRLEARGERITPASIRQNMQESASTPAGRKAASVAAELLTVFGRVVLFFVKFVAAVIGFSLVFSAIAIFMAMFTIPFDPHAMVVANGVSVLNAFEGMAMLSPALFAELVLLCVMLPLLVAGMGLLAFTFSWRLGRLFYSVTLGVWGIAVLFCGIVAASNVRFFNDELPYRIEHWDDRDWGHGRWERWDDRHDRDARDGGRWESSEGRRVSVDSLEAVAVDSLERSSGADSGAVSGSTSSDTSGEASGEVRRRRRVEIRRVD
jgi:phage shock protein PspC (stress-responsive transcriptional regulator)